MVSKLRDFHVYEWDMCAAYIIVCKQYRYVCMCECCLCIVVGFHSIKHKCTCTYIMHANSIVACVCTYYICMVVTGWTFMHCGE